MNPTHVVLRQVKDADDLRLVEASITIESDVLIEAGISGLSIILYIVPF
jgi:hypothetical protein